MSVAEEVKDYVEKRPYIQEALAEEIVNYSALARQVQEDVSGGFEAVKMALRRHSEELQEERRRRVGNVAEIMEGTSVELKSNMQVCVSPNEAEGEIFTKTEHGYTSIQEGTMQCDGEVIGDQIMITLKHPRDIEDTPGVLAYILSVLAGREINITEFISCREDTHFTVHEDDATEAFTLLDEKLS